MQTKYVMNVRNKYEVNPNDCKGAYAAAMRPFAKLLSAPVQH